MFLNRFCTIFQRCYDQIIGIHHFSITQISFIFFPSPIYRGFGLSESFSNHSGWFKKVYMPYVTTDQKIRRITQIIKSSTGNEIKFDYRQKNDSIQSKIFKKCSSISKNNIYPARPPFKTSSTQI